MLFRLLARALDSVSPALMHFIRNRRSGEKCFAVFSARYQSECRRIIQGQDETEVLEGRLLVNLNLRYGIFVLKF